MSTIDEIINSFIFESRSQQRHRDDDRFQDTRELIAAALADARREGAEQMQAEIEAQEPVAHHRASDAEWLSLGRCTTVYKDPAGDWKVPLYARPVPAQAEPESYPTPALDAADISDRLVAISSAIADSDDRKAQKLLRETLKALAAAQEHKA